MSTERDRQTTGSIGASRRGFLAGAAVAAGGLLIGSAGTASAASAAPAAAEPAPGRIVQRVARRGTRARSADVTIVRDDIRAYAQDPGRLQTFEDAMQQLKNRPDSDPTSFGAQAILHAGHCGGGPNAPTQIHYGARFLPWHRAFLYYFEQLLQSAVREPSLTLPYWNWTDQLTIPQPYWDAPLMPIAPKTQRALGTRPLNAQRTAINTILATPDFETFGGGAQGDGGNLEFGPHGYVHNTVGGRVGWMSDIQYSPRDPVFYAHHANIDRVWYLWMQDPSHHNEVDETDRYTFIDPAGRPVEITVAEILEWDVRYNEMPRLVSVAAQNARVQNQTLRTTFSIPAGSLTSRPDVERSPATLQLEDVVLPGDTPVTVDVFMEAAGAPAGANAGFVGSVSIVPVGNHHTGTVDVHLAVPAALAPLLQAGRNLQVRIEPVNENGVATGALAFQGFTLELH